MKKRCDHQCQECQEWRKASYARYAKSPKGLARKERYLDKLALKAQGNRVRHDTVVKCHKSLKTRGI